MNYDELRYVSKKGQHVLEKCLEEGKNGTLEGRLGSKA